MDFTAILLEMLSIKHLPQFNFSTHTSYIAISLLCTMSTAVLAESENYLRQEPIFPIPLKINVDKGKAELGEKLFIETRLSKNDQIACISCHQLTSGGDDNLPIGISISGEQHIINTPSIFNAQYNFRQNWDGAAKTLQDQINMAMTSTHEFDNNWDNAVTAISSDQELSNDFNAIYKDGVTKENIINSLVEFEKTLITPNSKFDQHLRSEDDILNDDEIKGYKIFKELGCISCHQGINIGGNLYQKFGVFYNYIAERGDIKKPDYGRINITDRLVDAYVFKVPSLRNIAVTAPYLHDGSAETIEEAISIMGKTQLGRSLSTDEVLYIKAFLNTLTGEYKNIPLDAES